MGATSEYPKMLHLKTTNESNLLGKLNLNVVDRAMF